MKKVFNPFLFAILLFAVIIAQTACNTSKPSDPSEIVLTGKIINPSGDSVFIRIMPIFGWDYAIHSAALNDEGEFVLEFNIDKSTPAQFYDGNEVSPMFLSPGDKLNVTLNTKDFDESIKYTGKGASENNFLAKKYLMLEDPPPNFWKLADSLSPEGFEKECQIIKDEQLALLKQYSTQDQANKSFINFQKTEYHFQFANNLFYYFMKNRDYKLHPDTINIPKYFFTQFEKTMEYTDPCQKSSAYNKYIDNFEAFTYYSADVKLNNKKESDSLLFLEINNKLAGLAKEKAIANQFYMGLASYTTDYFEENRQLFDENVTSPEIRDIVINKYETTKFELSKPMPENAILKDLNEEEFSEISFQEILNKYSGKVVYLDFWASWCGPCRGEMPNSLKMQEHFAGKDVAFVYISSDNGYEEWEAMIRVLQISGDHYRSNRKVQKEYDALFNVRYIPRYVLYDKDGNVVDSTAIRPSDQNIIAEIEKLL